MLIYQPDLLPLYSSLPDIHLPVSFSSNENSSGYVQRMMGHLSIILTVDLYGKWLPMGNRAAVDKLDDVA
jgi:hypothetical protein